MENVQTRLFRKLGVRNRSGALAVADAYGLLPALTPDVPPRGFASPEGLPSLPGRNCGPRVPQEA